MALNPIVFAAILSGLKGLGSLFGSKAKSAQHSENRDATIAALTLRQKMSEDQRRARLALAMGLLGGVPSTTAGGGVNTNLDLDPALIEQLSQERTYDFGPTVPESAGGASAFLSGLFGGAAETIPYIPGIAPSATVPTGATTPGSPGGAGPFEDPTFNLANPTVTLDDLDDDDEDD